jgi:hypothetical protein
LVSDATQSEGNRYLEVSHIGVIRSVEDANIRGEADENQTLNLEQQGLTPAKRPEQETER